MDIQRSSESQRIVSKTQRHLHEARREANAGSLGDATIELLNNLQGGLLKGEIRTEAREELREIAWACRHSDQEFRSAFIKANDQIGVLERNHAE